MLTPANPLEITRGRTFSLTQYLWDDVEGTESDMTGYTNFRCQVRTFTGQLIATLSATLEDSAVVISLTAAGSSNLSTGTYEIDILATDPFGNDEALMEVESIRVVNRPTSPTGGDITPADVPMVIPDFVVIGNEALDD